MATKAKAKTKKAEVEADVSLVEKLASELLGLMGPKVKPVVYEDKENDAIAVDIEAQDEAGLLIGSRGETLTSIQAVLGMMFRQRKGEWRRIIVNIADWRQRQEERLKQLARQTAERARSLKEPQPLYNLTPPERRIVHLALADDKDVETESVGEGPERYLIVRPKEK